MTGGPSHWLLVLLIGLAAFVSAGTARAQMRNGIPLATCFRPATAGLTARQLFADPAGFDCVRSQTWLPTGDYWVLSAPLPAHGPFMASIRTASVWQQRVTLYTLFADGTIGRTGYTSATTAPHLRLGAIIDLPLPEHAGAAPRRLLWHVEGSGGVRGVVVGAQLTGHEHRAQDDMTMTAVYAAFGGMGLALLLYNVALWRALRQPFQPAYCVMLLCLLAYACASSGWLGQMTGMDNNLRLRINNVTLGAAAASAIVFARAFFERPVFAGWVNVLTRITIAALLGTTIAFAILAPWFIAPLSFLIDCAYALLMPLVGAVFWRAWRVRSSYLSLFALAWGAPIVLAGIRIAAAFDLVEWEFWIDNSTIPAMALEACLSGLAIAGRIRLISRERDEARAQEIAARLLADTDPLTGLLNRRAFLSRAIGRVGDQALVIVDIDHFKQVNETIGHDGGDEVLRIFARTMRDWAGAETLVARMGGEEFAAVFDAAATPDAHDLLDRLRATRMPYDLTVTASIGACLGPLAREPDWKRLYQAADRALFQAKAAGRDRSRMAEPLAA